MDNPDKWGRVNDNDEIVEADPMRDYNLIHVDDVAMILEYITTLHQSCEKWSEDGN